MSTTAASRKGKTTVRTAVEVPADHLAELAAALTAFRNGDFTVRLGRRDGLLGDVVDRFNEVADLQERRTRELVRVSHVIGREGRMTERLSELADKGDWATSATAVNNMIDDLVRPTTEVARVIEAVAEGDLSQHMALEIAGQPVKGEFERIGTTVNKMVDQLSSFADEVTRVAREVGTEGKLGGQAQVRGVSGVWRDLTANVNSMAANLTTQVRNIAQVTTAVAQGDLSQKITVDAKGEILELKSTVNTMVDQLSSFADEVTRVAREVGTEGRLGGQAEVRGVSGTWRDLTDSVNSMAANLTDQVRNIAQVATAVAKGDLSQKITVEAKGEVAALAETMNAMVDQLSSFADEVTRVAREVGTEGQLGGQADVPGVAGTWKDLTDAVNSMAGNLTSQVRNIAQIVTAVARGDLSQKITVDAKGEVAALADTINSLTDTLRVFAEQVTTVAREVGTEGKLGGQAEVPGVAGTWKDLTDSVNSMASNLTDQVRDIAQVTTAVAKGDLSQKVSVDVRGETLELKSTINTMVDQLSSFADEVTRVAREVGTEGRLGGQAQVKGVSGTWRDLTDNVNYMAANLTGQVRNIAQVATAVAKGDLSQSITVDAQGEILELKNTVNTMVDQLSSFADEVTRVAREVGTDGKLGGQAQVKGVSGTWRDLTDNVNSMAANLTSQVRNIAQVTTAVAQGDLSQKITVDAKGEVAALAQTINTMVDQLSSFADEVTRVAREVGTEGRLGGQAQVKGVSGTWRDLTDNVNYMAANLTGQVRNIAQVATAVAQGDLSQKITVDAQGEILELKNTVNTMVDQLSSFADEVTRVAREVGTEGRLGGQAQVRGVSGTWKDLTDSVNSMASNLTSQVRNIAQVTTAVAQGDLSQKITVDAQGEILELKSTVNTMVDQLSSFAAEVTRVAREVGTEGRLGGQAEVAGVSGTWRDLTENVNQLAGNLTTQVRAIAEVSTAVTRGDLTRSISVEAQGEVAELKDNINQMIANLRETTEKNAQTDWLRSNLARIGGRMQGQRDLQALCAMLMIEITSVVQAQQGAFFLLAESDAEPVLRLTSAYGYAEGSEDEDAPVSRREFRLGEGLVGQAAVDKTRLRVEGVPAGYLTIKGGLGEAPPSDVVVLPVLFEEQVLGVIELASFLRYSEQHLIFLDQLVETIGVVLNTIIANTRTEELLAQSQRLTQELQVQSDELQRTNAELQEKAQLLTEQSRDLETKNREIELARAGLEEKALQLELASQYKSEFLANMSHELRTPLNSLLILAKLLSDNPESNLTDKQIEFARTIHRAGSDLLELINDILDLSKVEAGKMDVRPSPIDVRTLCQTVEQSFLPVAEQKGLSFVVNVEGTLQEALTTDEQRLRQVLKNLLSNAFKFTDTGRVTLRVHQADASQRFGVAALDDSDEPVMAFSVSDTGIGVAADKLRHIFEAFQQADGTTSRKYGGTGLGLSISREIARLLGGAIAVESEEGVGSTFTLYVPQTFPYADAVQLLPAQLSVQESGRGPIIAAPPMLDGEAADYDSTSLAGATILVVDDDVRNVFALTSALEMHGAVVLYADNGNGGLKTLQEHPEVDLVLMDVMMPEMDGNETTATIRQMPGREQLPVLFLTAKAMPGDREKSIAAGASDYITKPVDLDRLLHSMRQWLGGTRAAESGTPATVADPS
jgi:HAMP domain-containing protein/signal transduction histidine kinase/ActR/RegA family two-component response regulator